MSEQRELPYFKSYDMIEPVPKRRRYVLRKRVRDFCKPPYFPFAAQGSQKWLDLRKGMLTASDWGVALGEGHGGPDAVLYKKCGVGKRFTGSTATRWGHQYEEVAVQIYERRNKTKIIEFGLIPHSRYDFLGASPDGITEDGVMVEIKCPYSRHITGEPPRHYWCQVQAQLEVCNLDRADFLECKLEEYDTEEEYWLDEHETGEFALASNGMEKGIMMKWWDRKSFKNTYSYLPLGLSREDALEWCDEEEKRMKGVNPKYRFEDLVFWNLTRVSCIEIPRDKKWFKEALPKLRKMWDRVLYHREHGLAEKPKRKKKLRAFPDYKANPLKGANPFMHLSNKVIKKVQRKSDGGNAAAGPKRLFGNPFASKNKLLASKSGKRLTGNPFASKAVKKKTEKKKTEKKKTEKKKTESKAEKKKKKKSK